MSLFEANVRYGSGSSLVQAANDGKHRPASHPVYAGLPRFDTATPEWPIDGPTLRARRLARDLSQRDLGHLVGVSHATIHHWEADKVRPSAEHEARLREVLA